MDSLGGGASLNLTSSTCSEDAELGVFGFAFGPVCSGAPLVDNFLYGDQGDRDGDGTITCADHDSSAENQGILFSLLCSEALIQFEGIESMRFEEGSDGFAISFLDFDASDATDAVGSWTPAGEAAQKYPANMRIWSPVVDTGTLTGSLAMSLTDETSGRVAWNLFPFGEDYSADIQFGTPTDSSLCATEPSKENCYWQDMSFKGNEVYTGSGVAPGMRVLVLADSKDSPSFYHIEGKIRYTESYANVLFDPTKSDSLENFEQVREIYMRAIQKEDEIWGYFDFRDDGGTTVSSMLGAYDLGSVLKNGLGNVEGAGICQKIGSDDFVNCDVIDYQDYETTFIGDADFDGIDASYEFPIDFGELPENGVILAE